MHLSGEIATGIFSMRKKSLFLVQGTFSTFRIQNSHPSIQGQGGWEDSEHEKLPPTLRGNSI